MASANLDTQLAALDADILTRMATYTQPTGFLAATFPTTIASTTNITGGTITTTTNLTNAPTAGDFTATMKTSIGTAVAASAVASVTGNVGGNVTGTVGGFAASPTGVRLAKNVALNGFEFPMYLTGTSTPATGKTVTATRSLDGGAFAATTNSPTELSNGVYILNLSAADTNGNTVTYKFSASACDDTIFSGVTEGT